MRYWIDKQDGMLLFGEYNRTITLLLGLQRLHYDFNVFYRHEALRREEIMSIKHPYLLKQRDS